MCPKRTSHCILSQQSLLKGTLRVQEEGESPFSPLTGIASCLEWRLLGADWRPSCLAISLAGFIPATLCALCPSVVLERQCVNHKCKISPLRCEMTSLCRSRHKAGKKQSFGLALSLAGLVPATLCALCPSVVLERQCVNHKCQISPLRCEMTAWAV